MKDNVVVLFYLRVKGLSNNRLPLFGEHISHEKVAPTGDGALHTILLTGKVYLKTPDTLDDNWILGPLFVLGE